MYITQVLAQGSAKNFALPTPNEFSKFFIDPNENNSLNAKSGRLSIIEPQSTFIDLLDKINLQ